MAGGVIIPGEDDQLFAEPELNGAPMYPEAEPVEGTGGFMDDDAFQFIIGRGIEAAENLVDTHLSPEREKAARYYDGEPFGNELEDRSQVVLTETRDAILAMMPGLLRIFCGTTNPVEFETNPGTPSEQADQQTRYVSHVIFRDNSGFEIVHDAIKDALLKKTGIFTWWWEELEDVTATRFTDLPADALTLLQLEAQDRSDADVGLEYEVEIEDQRPDETQPQGDMLAEPLSEATDEDKALVGEETPVLSSGIVRKRVLRRRVRVAAIPPEEFITSGSTTRDLDRFQLIGRRQMLTMSEVVALGHDEDEVREALGGQGDTHGSLETNPEAIQRNQGIATERLFDTGFAAEDPASELVKYCVVYCLVDYDGDGIAERRKIITVGHNYHIIYNEIYDDDMVPFGTICPDPEAHSPFGGSVFDWTKDIQEINSELARGVLDSLSESISGQRAVNKRTVNLDDALNPARGALIRVDGDPNGAVADLAKPFIGVQALPVLQYMGEVKTRRTGTNPAAPSAIDADALQSTAKEGVQAAVDASQERIEMIARIFAETGFSRLFRGVRNLLMRHQDYRRTLRLMGKPVTVDPRTWNADLDLVVHAGIGRGMGAKRLAGLQFMYSQQLMMIQQYGPSNGVVEMEEFSYTLHEMARELGFSDPTRFAKAYTPEMQQKAEQMAEAMKSQPSPQQLLFQAQQAKTQAELQAKLAALSERREAAIRADATKRRDADMRFAVEAAKLMGQFGQQVEAQAETLRGEEREDAHRLADDLNAASPEAAPQAIPAPQPQPQGNPDGA
jgi:hypothetical protein